MTVTATERKERKKIRLTICRTIEQSCEDCPIAKSKSANSRYHHCGTKCPVGQKLQSLGEQLITKESPQGHWTEEEDFYLVKNYPFYTTRDLAIRLDRSMEDIRGRFKYLVAIAETSSGSSHHDLRD